VAKVCYSCGKKPDFGNARSHSLRATRRRRDPNLQKVRIQEGATMRREWVCTSCLKGFKVTKASIGARPA
jgi:large subunit ribosomal protein L28